MGDDDAEKTFEGEWGKAKIHADGSATAETKAGKVEVGEDGFTRVSISTTIQKVSIDNVVDLRSHKIRTDVTATTHHMIFRNGGEVRFSYRPDGRVLELRTSRGTAMQISPEGEIRLGLSPKQDQAP